MHGDRLQLRIAERFAASKRKSSLASPHTGIDVLVPHSRIATSTNLLLHVAYCCTHTASDWHVRMEISTKHCAKATCCSAACLALFAALCTAVPAYASVVEIITGRLLTASTALHAENS